jgi:hypothetical protein
MVIEFFCELDQIHDEELGFFEPRPWHQDRPQRPKVWGDDTASNWWGPMSRSASHGDAAAPKTPRPQHEASPKSRTPALAHARTRQPEKKSRGKPKTRR